MSEEIVTVDSLKALYLELKDKVMQTGTITEDITKLVWRGFREKLIKKERLTIVIKGQTTKGKSTSGLYIKWRINKIIKDLSENKENKITTTYKGEEDEYDLISANQIEYLRVARRDDIQHVCTLVDEFSDMAGSGYNATTEQNLLEWYDKVCAQKYLHTIYCTPRNDYDKFGIIVMEVLDVEKEKGITKLKVYYNNPTDTRMVFLGYMTINVTDILKQEWYELYRQRKQFAMDLLLKQSIKDPRELEFALVTLISYQKSKRLAELGVKDIDIITTKVDESVRETKAVYSILSGMAIASKVKALLTPIVNTEQLKNELRKNRKEPLTEKQREEIKEKIQIYKEEFIKLYNHHMDLINLHLDYVKIGNKSQEKTIKDICEKYELNKEVENYGRTPTIRKGLESNA